MGTGAKCWVTDAEVVAAALGTMSLFDIANSVHAPRLDPEVVDSVDASVEAVFAEIHAEIEARASAA